MVSKDEKTTDDNSSEPKPTRRSPVERVLKHGDKTYGNQPLPSPSPTNRPKSPPRETKKKG